MDGKILVSEQEIQNLVGRLAREVQRDYQDKTLIVLGVLKGAAVFMADLIRQISLPLTCDYIRVSSYQKNGSQGELRLELDLSQPVAGKDVLVIEDVVDTGKTLGFIQKHLGAGQARSVRFCTLLQKEHAVDQVTVDYVGKVIPNHYVIGYGMDLDGLHRNLPWVEQLELTKP